MEIYLSWAASQGLADKPGGTGLEVAMNTKTIRVLGGIVCLALACALAVINRARGWLQVRTAHGELGWVAQQHSKPYDGVPANG